MHMVALIMFGVLTAYLVLIVILARLSYKWRGTRQKIVIVFLIGVILIPTWDIPLDRYRFNQLCKKEAGIFVYEKVELPQEFYLTPGQLTNKIIYREDGASGLRSVKATGDELNMEKLKERYVIDDSFDENIVNWGKVSRFTTTVSDGDKLLGKAVSLNGGDGWIFVKFTYGTRRTCPEKTPRPGYMSIHEKVLYEIFYKQQNLKE